MDTRDLFRCPVKQFFIDLLFTKKKSMRVNRKREVKVECQKVVDWVAFVKLIVLFFKTSSSLPSPPLLTCIRRTEKVTKDEPVAKMRPLLISNMFHGPHVRLLNLFHEKLIIGLADILERLESN